MPKDRPWPATSSKQNFHGSISKIDKSKERKKSKDPILKLLPALVLLKIIMSRASNVSATKKKKNPTTPDSCSAPCHHGEIVGTNKEEHELLFFWVEKKRGEERVLLMSFVQWTMAGCSQKVTIGDTPICFTEPYTHGKEGSDFLVNKVKICPILSRVLGIATKKEQSRYQPRIS